MPLTIRPRRPEDVAAVGALIMRQQPLTHYPFRNPLPFPVEEFVVRRGELASWVAELDGAVVGHVSVLDVTDHDIGPEWSAGTGRPVEELAAVSVLVVDHEYTGLGIGGRLMDVCEAHVRDLGRHPVLEVVGGAHARAVSLYLSRGWRILGDVKPHWLPEGEGPVHIMDLPSGGAVRR
ncbi:GNAT family N-acetyltransferase [Nocardioides sp. HDW12B]|uniref:GNAT family N-acetyltransferase n=1 Tax=Nocardioides sp. HDW12B TaxID=2714939 RepID=UPI00140B5E5F|nr:GNAT family N-acetyltransferase [Nocardioides sp. HDW12B]QIK67857.1 GNAT family N-acetyltransferase [Nocardioides sp. HDW12B]